ncbi:MAG: prolyl oligopeptidase family serine peptidase [Saprospiraceae bacterium]
MIKNLLFLVLSFTLFTSSLLVAQGPTREDYKRAVSLLWSNLVNKKVFNINVQPIWFRDSSGLGFITQDKSKKTFNKLLFKSQKIENWFDHERLSKVLSDSLHIPVKSTDLPIQVLAGSDNSHLEFNYKGLMYNLNFMDYSIKMKKIEKENDLESTSPDGKWTAYMDHYNLFIKSTVDGKIKALSTHGERLFEYGTYYGWSDIIEGENGERPKRLSIYWSPDSKWIQTYITDMRSAKKMFLLDWSVDSLYKPKLLSYYRGSPGDTNMVRMIPVFYNVGTSEEYIKSSLQSTHTNPIDYEWSKTPDIIYQENSIRGYQAVELHRVNLNSKTEELLYRETNKTNIDNYESNIIEPWNKAVIISERSGWKQLFTLDLTSKVLNPLTNGAYYINDINRIDTLHRTIFFTASGKETGRNPYYQHLYKLSMDNLQVDLMTPENANHEIAISPDCGFFIDNISTLNQPTRTLLMSMGPVTVPIELSKVNITALDSLSFKAPESFTAIGRDGHTTLYGAMWKPISFDANKKYPVIDQSYTGPHTFMYPRNFIGAMARSNQALAELGFIVITVDGMGTANRSKAFHDVSYKNMGKNLEDHRLAILQLGRQYKWMDTSRVGIFGHSAGGFDAGHAVLEYPDFYKVAVASSGDHDFRMEKDWWPEMYMGWPVDSTYNIVSNITMAGNLKGKLLITHGGIDENVNPSATFKLAEALIKANKEFDMLILPSQHHGYQGIYNDYFTKKMWNYFVENLLGAKSIWDIEMR